MTIKQLQAEALKLPTHQKWQLVQSLLDAIQQETQLRLAPAETSPETSTLETLDPWVRSLVGAIDIPECDRTELYTDYLEKKYN